MTYWPDGPGQDRLTPGSGQLKCTEVLQPGNFLHKAEAPALGLWLRGRIRICTKVILGALPMTAAWEGIR